MAKLNFKNRTLTCVYCNTLIKDEWPFLGKRLYVGVKCPNCKLQSEFPLLKRSDQIFLRLGFLFNPLYLPAKEYVSGAPFKLVMFFYPLLLLFYVALNLLYVPFGLIYNNIKISRSKKRFYFDNENISKELIYYGNLRKLADEGDSYAALLVGKKFLHGETYAQNYAHAEHYLTIALESYAEAGLELGLYNFYQKDYTRAYHYFNQSKKAGKSLYYLALMHAKGLGVPKNLRLAKPLFYEAETTYFVDPYDLKSILR